MKNAIIVVLIILLLFSLELNRRFYNNYVAESSYDVEFYPQTRFKTGDLIFFRALDSRHLLWTDTFFSHVGVIVVYNSVPYIFEMTPPNVKFSPIRERLAQYFSGSAFVKPLNKPLPSHVIAKIPSLIAKYQALEYPSNGLKSVTNYVSNCSDYWQNDKFECAKIIAFFLRDIGLLTGNEAVGCNGISFLANLRKLRRPGYKYLEPKQLSTINDSRLPKRLQYQYRSII